MNPDILEQLIIIDESFLSHSLTQGAESGFIVGFTVGFIALGINLCLKLFGVLK
ncbi:MAG: hypothetical protein AB2417_20100 [Clostridiaceae bacterium]